MPAASSTWRTATYVKSGGEGTARDRTASRPSSSPGSSSSRSGPCSTRKRSYRARRRASPRDRARITRRKSGPRSRPRTLATIMTTPPIDAATPRVALALLERLTTLSRELAGAFRPSSVVELVARALTELLRPDRLSIVLLDVETNRLAVAYDSAPVPTVTDDPLLQLALRRGPLAFTRDVAAEAARLGVELGDAAPASWSGAPRTPLARPAPARVGRLRDARARRPGQHVRRGPRRRADPAAHGLPDHRSRRRRGPRVRGPNREAPSAGPAHTV